jgi:type I restriction enzyme S subunit
VSTETLAPGWAIVPLGSLLTDIQPGFASGRHNSSGVGIPHLRPMNVSSDGSIDRSVLKFVDPDEGRRSVRLQRGDVLFNNTNSPELVGKTALFDGDDAPAFSNHMTRLRVDQSTLDPGFLALRLHQAWREGWFATHCNNHVSQASIGRDVLRDFQIELPPLDVQRELVLLARQVKDLNDSVVSHLGRASKGLDRFRQAALAAACTGALTGEWRQNRPDPKPILLPNSGGSRPKQLRSLDTYPLGDIPEGWRWVQINDLLPPGGIFDGPFGSNLKTSDYTASGARVVRLENIGQLVFNDDKRTYVSTEKFKTLAKHAVGPGDIVLSSFVEAAVRVCVLPDSLESPALAKADCFTIRPLREIVSPSFLAIQLACTRSHELLVSDVHGATRPRVNTTQVRGLPIPICSPEEQDEIVQRFHAIDDLLEKCFERLGATNRNLARSRMAIMRKAFRGDLLIGDAA